MGKYRQALFMLIVVGVAVFALPSCKSEKQSATTKTTKNNKTRSDNPEKDNQVVSSSPQSAVTEEHLSRWSKPCLQRLSRLGELLEAYQQAHAGKMPSTIEDYAELTVCPGTNKPFVYLGNTLPDETDVDMIVAYDAPPLIQGYRHVLMSRGIKHYFVKGKEVTASEYEDAVKGFYLTYDREFIQVVNDTVMLQTPQGWQVIADAIVTRANKLTEEEFQQLLRRDKQMRKQRDKRNGNG